MPWDFTLNVICCLFSFRTTVRINLLGLSYTGAAIATAIAAMVMFITVRLIVKRLTGTGTEPRILKHLFAAGVAGAVDSRR